jgi:endonuclease/exonuclease/phosphatase family metal-dependent hydrolase
MADRGGRLLVLIDDSAYRRNVPDAERLEQRRNAWTRIAAEYQLTVVNVELDQVIREREQVNALMNSMHEALWPARETAAAG